MGVFRLAVAGPNAWAQVVFPYSTLKRVTQATEIPILHSRAYILCGLDCSSSLSFGLLSRFPSGLSPSWTPQPAFCRWGNMIPKTRYSSANSRSSAKLLPPGGGVSSPLESLSQLVHPYHPTANRLCSTEREFQIIFMALLTPRSVRR